MNECLSQVVSESSLTVGYVLVALTIMFFVVVMVTILVLERGE